MSEVKLTKEEWKIIAESEEPGLALELKTLKSALKQLVEKWEAQKEAYSNNLIKTIIGQLIQDLSALLERK